MKLLDKIFKKSIDENAKEIEIEIETLIQHWEDYLNTILRKKEIIINLTLDEKFEENLKQLRELLRQELVDISEEEREDSILFSELDNLAHTKKIQRVERLRDCLAYEETKIEYLYGLLEHLHTILKTQMQIIEQLASNQSQFLKYDSHLKAQLELEREVANQIVEFFENEEEFYQIFHSIIRGEHEIRVLSSKEKELYEGLKKDFNKIFNNKVNEGILFEWTIKVFNTVEDLIRDHEAIIATGYLQPHSSVDFQYVNSPRFVEIARNVMEELIRERKEKNETKEIIIPEEWLAVFVHAFREWYNHERESISIIDDESETERKITLSISGIRELWNKIIGK